MGRPTFPAKPNLGFCNVKTANTALDGTGTAPVAFTAGTNGSTIDCIIVRPKGVIPATVLRFFVNNGQDPSVAGNNALIHEMAVDAVASVNQTSALQGYDVKILDDDGSYRPIINSLPAGYRILVSTGTSLTTVGCDVTVSGADL